MSWIELLRDLGVFGLVAFTVQALIKKGIDRAALEHRVRYSALHTRRVEVIGKSYEMLVRAEQTLKWASDVSPAPSETRERLGEFGKAANSFFEFFDCNRIWLSPTLCARLDEFWSALKEAGYSASDAVAPLRQGSLLDCRRRVMAEKCKPVKDAVESEFRATLGVD